MKNNITTLEINNFKSIKHIKMDCKRINVLIGKPNVGKSNILEALSLYATPFCDSRKKILEDYVRYEKLTNLFYDQDRKKQITVSSNLGFASIRFNQGGDISHVYDIALGPLDLLKQINSLKSYNRADYVNLLRSFSIKKQAIHNEISPYCCFVSSTSTFYPVSENKIGDYDSPIKKYHFKSLSKHPGHFPHFLMPPFGDNLYEILESSPALFDECSHFFNDYGLELLVDTVSEKIDVQKKVGNRVYKIPYSLAADTLQRVIFHLAAIETNKNSVLLFEEPENHSFPPFISMLANKIIESKENQYFIATHSPYLLRPFIEECPIKEVNIFIATYENHETKVRALTAKEIKNIMDTDIDLFYNISAFSK